MNSQINPLTLTRNLLAFNTTNPPGLEKPCAEYIGTILKQGGFDIDYYDLAAERTNLIARLRGGSNSYPLYFSGHIDTIPVGDSDWSKDPFNGETEGDKIYGRGSTDMKGGVAAMVIACLRLAELSKGKTGITLIITASEENGCLGAHYLAQHGTILGTAGALIVGEPTSNYPLIGHKGAIFLEAETYGTAAHGSMPEQGSNAIYKAAHAVRKLETYDFDFPAHPLFGPPTLNVGTITGGNSMNVVPDHASIGVDIRTVPGQSNEKVMANIESCLGTDIELTCLTNADAVFTDPKHEWVQHVYDIMESYLSERPVPRGASYFTDASALAAVMGNPPTIILGPGEPEMAHKTDEFCYISKIEEAAAVYIEIGRTWLGL